jgi:anti-sigma factor RsiW
MSCDKFEPLIALYIEDDLAQAEAHVVESHLAGCDGCREFAAEMRESQAALKALRTEFVDDAVLLQVRTEVLSVASHRHYRVVTWPRYAVAAGLVLALLGGWMWQMRPREPRVRLEPRPIAASVSAPPLVATVPAPQARTHTGVSRARRHGPQMTPVFKSEPLVVKMITDDPQVVIYWLVDQNGG